MSASTESCLPIVAIVPTTETDLGVQDEKLHSDRRRLLINDIDNSCGRLEVSRDSLLRCLEYSAKIRLSNKLSSPPLGYAQVARAFNAEGHPSYSFALLGADGHFQATTKGQPGETVFYGDEPPQAWRDQELIQRYRNALVDYWLIEEEKRGGYHLEYARRMEEKLVALGKLG